jgi:hypothetical protein
MRVFGMSLLPEKLSDEQYIERIRKSVHTRQRWRYVQGSIAALVLGMTFWLLWRCFMFLSDFDKVPGLTGNNHLTPSQLFVYFAFIQASFFGFIFGYFFYKVVFFIVEMFFGFRQQKLLVDCWDALSDAEKSRLRQRSS